MEVIVIQCKEKRVPKIYLNYVLTHWFISSIKANKVPSSTKHTLVRKLIVSFREKLCNNNVKDIQLSKLF